MNDYEKYFNFIFNKQGKNFLELRIFQWKPEKDGIKRKPYPILSGQFDQLGSVIDAVGEQITKKDIMVCSTINPARRLEAIKLNHIGKVSGQGSLTHDVDIISRNFFVFDVDIIRQVGHENEPASDAEKEKILPTVRQVHDDIGGMLIDSGNGYHVITRLSKPLDERGEDNFQKEKFKIFEGNLNQKYLSDEVKRDYRQACSFLIKAAGTYNYKGKESPGRPHRQSRILEFTPEKCLDLNRVLEIPTSPKRTRIFHEGLKSNDQKAEASIGELLKRLTLPLHVKLNPRFRSFLRGFILKNASKIDRSKYDIKFCLWCLENGLVVEEIYQLLKKLSQKAATSGKHYAEQTVKKAIDKINIKKLDVRQWTKFLYKERKGPDKEQEAWDDGPPFDMEFDDSLEKPSDEDLSVKGPVQNG